jgi:hypothetical protein
VAISGGIALIGAGAHLDHLGGRAFVFDLESGSLLRVLAPPVSESGDYFGSAVAIGDAFLVGAPGNGPDPGAAFLFDLRSGDFLQELLPDPHPSMRTFGAAASMDGGLALVCAPDVPAPLRHGGVLYVFQRLR